MKKLLMTAVLLAGVAACGPDQPDSGSPSASVSKKPVVTAATLGEQTILANSEYLKQPEYAAADLRNGESQALLCQSCHTLAEGGMNRLGPNLYGVFGRPAATNPDFDYSAAIAESGIVWTPAALDAWLAEPSRFLPGTRMIFAGIRDQQDRNDLLAYLLSITDDSGVSPARE